MCAETVFHRHRRRMHTRLLKISCSILLFAAGCSRNPDDPPPAPPPPENASAARPLQETWPCMGTFATLKVSENDGPRLKEFVETARSIFRELEESLSVFNTNSEISALNRSAGGKAVPVSPRTCEVLEMSLKYAEMSGGCFDVTVAPLVKAWGFAGGTPPAKPLDDAAIGEALGRIGYRHLSISNGTARLDRPGMSVNLGGLAKGYAVDICYERLVAMGARNVMVDLGGNIRCGGTDPNGRAWRIGVRDPFDRDAIIGTVLLTNGMAIGTSGNYEKFYMIGGKRYTHIIDPRTGYPVSDMAGVTVISTNAVETEGMTKPLFILGVEGSTNLLAKMPWCHALLIPSQEPVRIHMTPGFRKIFTPEPAFADKVNEIPVSVPEMKH